MSNGELSRAGTGPEIEVCGKTIDAVIPVYHPDETLLTLLRMLKAQKIPVRRIILMLTEAPGDARPDLSGFDNVECHSLTPREFDHGNTRNAGFLNSDADYVLAMTQDAEPVSERLTEALLSAFSDPETAVAYGRQLPRSDCRIIERYTRSFNYPEISSVKSAEDIERLGIKAFFCSNVCAMYDRAFFEKIGGFTKHTIFNEDMIYAAGVLKAGLKVAYRADAEVLHSHNLSGREQLRRNFDLGVSQADHPEVFSGVPSEKEGMSLVKKTAAYLWSCGKGYWIPYLIYQSGMKYLGYKLGKNYRKLPKGFAVFCSMNKHYWED